MKNNLLKKCLMTLCLFLFFTLIIPIPIVNNIMIAKASEPEQTKSDIWLNVKSKSLVKDTSYALKIYNMNEKDKVNYKTSSSSIAEVSDDGVITAKDFGNATITVTIKDGFKTVETLQCEVTVGPPAISIVLTKSEISLAVGRKTTLIAILKPNNTVEDALFFSNDPEIASVSIGGRVTAKSVGETYIYASISNGKNVRCKVTVTKEDLEGNVEQEEPTQSNSPAQSNSPTH